MFEKILSLSEARRFYAVGLPIFIAQLSQTGMTFADTAMSGLYSAQALAAVAVAGSIWAPVALLGIGCLLALSPLSAQLVGSGRPDLAAHLLRQALELEIVERLAAGEADLALETRLAEALAQQRALLARQDTAGLLADPDYAEFIEADRAFHQAMYAALGLGLASKLLEGWTGAVLAKIAVLVFIIIFIQKRPQGIFAMKGRSAEA